MFTYNSKFVTASLFPGFGFLSVSSTQYFHNVPMLWMPRCTVEECRQHSPRIQDLSVSARSQWWIQHTTIHIPRKTIDEKREKSRRNWEKLLLFFFQGKGESPWISQTETFYLWFEISSNRDISFIYEPQIKLYKCCP